MLVKLHAREPLIFLYQVNGLHQLGIVLRHGLLLLLIHRQGLRKVRGQNVTFPQRILHHRRLPIQPRLRRLDQRFGGQQQKVFLERIVQPLRAHGVVHQALLAVQDFQVARGQRVQQIVQIGVPQIEDARVRRWSHYDGVFIPVTARLNLIGRGLQFDENLETAPLEPRGRLTQVGIDRQHRADNRLMVFGELWLNEALRRAPQTFDIGFFVKRRQ